MKGSLHSDVCHPLSPWTLSSRLRVGGVRRWMTKKAPPTRRTKSANRDNRDSANTDRIPPADTMEGIAARLLNPMVDQEEATEYDRSADGLPELALS
jgi:hypothetical protein